MVRMEAGIPASPTIPIRARFFDEAPARPLVGHRVVQVVLVAAGMDARAFRSQLPDGVRAFEADRPEVVEVKGRRGASSRRGSRRSVGRSSRSDPHMGAHALAAAAYAAKAAGLAAPDQADAASEENHGSSITSLRRSERLSGCCRPWARIHPARWAPGLLASGLLGKVVRDLQARLSDSDHAPPPPIITATSGSAAAFASKLDALSTALLRNRRPPGRTLPRHSKSGYSPSSIRLTAR